ncbi:MAG: PRC-barrel domain-containing protein [Solirubrobacteraceae bacterium]
MDELGAPISYEVLEKGTPVFSRDGARLGTVEHVLAAEGEDIFDGIVIDTSAGPGGHRFADAEQVDSIHERGVTLTLDAQRSRRLPEPSANPPAMRADPSWGDTADERLLDKLRRAWDILSGNY